MALFDDLAKGNVVTGVAMGVLALALPTLVPSLRAPLRAALKAGLTLFLESEWEVEGDVADGLVEAAMQSLGAIIARPGWQHEDRQAAEAVVKRFKATARHRAHRWGADDKDRASRYRRHLAKLQHAVANAKNSGPETAQPDWHDVSAMITEDW